MTQALLHPLALLLPALVCAAFTFVGLMEAARFWRHASADTWFERAVAAVILTGTAAATLICLLPPIGWALEYMP